MDNERSPEEMYHIRTIERMRKHLRSQIKALEEKGHAVTRQKIDQAEAIEWALDELRR